jgi:hypothetical protein
MGFNENPASQQSQNQGFESVNKKRSSASAYDISDIVNNRVKQASANNGGKVDSSLFFFSFFLFSLWFFSSSIFLLRDFYAWDIEKECIV